MLSLDEFDKLKQQVSNWGRWGAEDQRGSLNFITRESVRKAAATVISGETFSLAIDLSLAGPQNGVGVPGRINPLRTMLAINEPMGDSPHASTYNDDIVITPTQTGTHWDALSHCGHEGMFYNGIPTDVVDAGGAAKLGIEAAGIITGRAVLLDVARHVGVDALPRKFAITRTVLEEVERAQAVTVEPGDIVVVRTGLMRYFLDHDIPGYRTDVPALDYDAPLFLHERGAAAMAIDNMPVELLPSNVEEVAMPVHILCLVMMGMPLGENFVLEDLARACDADRRYQFLLGATPERFLRSTGGIVNPVAMR